MTTLGGWMNKTLVGWGVDPKIANTFDETIIAILIIAVAIGLDYRVQPRQNVLLTLDVQPDAELEAQIAQGCLRNTNPMFAGGGTIR